MEIRNSSLAEALPREEADFDFGLIEPASVSGRVVNGEPIPDFAADLRAEQVRQWLETMDVQIVHDQMDGFGLGILQGQFKNHLRKLEA